MNVTDELAEITKEVTEANTRYNKLLEKLFRELNKYLSFIDKRKLNLVDKVICYENYDNQLNTFKVLLFFHPKYFLPNISFCTVEIKSDFKATFLNHILTDFCIDNDLIYEII